ncbi:uncharacterized protein LOC127259838 [Andrographis paniculata]|uniref:uncharacterized protein LOC127259838 n=1 Tax=Andrographis paniculata TaxID=175694 RepID=UPI0021E74978|nr:uncharacterized protein LOC127259838 [Andrographis paniculata]
MAKYLRLEDMALVAQGKESGGVPYQCPMLTSSNYTTLAIRMEAILDAQGLWESVEPPDDAVVYAKKSKSARAFIFQGLPEDVLLQVAKKKTAKEVWDSLKLCYLGADRVQRARLHTLKSEFEALRMKEGETIDEFTRKLNGMMSKYNSLVATLEDSVLAVGRLKAYEDRLLLRSGNGRGETSLLLTRTENQQVNKAAGGSSGGRGRGLNDRRGRGGRGRGLDRAGRGKSNWQRDAGNNNYKPREKKHIKCFNCEKYGHYASESRAPKEKGGEANLVETQEDEPALLLSVHGEKKNTLVLLNEKCVCPSTLEGTGEAREDV